MPDFSGEITVASRIIDALSSGLYESPAACLKELVNNSYDADAALVELFVRPDADRIIISDDGEGLNRGEFQRHFKRISESHKRDDSDVTNNGRPKIGKIGIGFIAANEICDVMEIISTQRGSRELLKVEIDFAKMRLDPSARRKSGGAFAKGDYHGRVTQTAGANEHYTHVFLKNVRGEARAILVGAKTRGRGGEGISLYGRSPETVADRLARLAAWSDLDLYSQTMVRVAENVPVRYAPRWISRNFASEVAEFERAVAKLAFTVEYDGTELRKPTVLRASPPRALVMPFIIDGQHVAARGYFFAQHGALRPQDLNGVLIRIRHAAVGGYDGTFMEFPSTEGTLFQRWISAEVWADDRLEDALNIDRRTLRVTHPAFVELQRAFHDELSDFIRTVKSSIYQAQAVVRNEQKAIDELERLEKVTREGSGLSASAAAELGQQWEEAAGGRTPAILRRYSVAQLYEAVIDVAEEFMDPPTLRRFIRRLTDRLTS